MLSLKSVRLRYGAQEVLSLGKFEAAAGEHWLVLGASGSGKTSLLNILAGLLKPSEGMVEVDGTDIAKMKSGVVLDRWRGRNVGVVPQKLHLVSSLGVLDNLLLAPYLAKLPVDGARAAELLETLSLKDKMVVRPHQLSHGQAQRVAVARAVMNRPKLLLADEPTSNLDDASAEAALELLQSQARACGATLLVATHDQRAKPRFEKVLQL